jgi:Spy/CpxP family protein refolding chaperone
MRRIDRQHVASVSICSSDLRDKERRIFGVCKEHNEAVRRSGTEQELRLAATPIYNRCLISCMNLKSLLRAVATMLFFGTLSTALVANAASPDPSPAAGATTKHKASPDAVKAARLTRLKNQAGLTADQEAKAKPIIDKYVDDRQAANGNRAKLVSLKTQFDTDIDGILTPDQRTKLAAAKTATADKMKAARAKKAAAGAVASPSPAKTN